MLVVVLWVMGLVSVGVGSLAMRATHELRLGRAPLAALQRHAIAEAAVERAIAVLGADDPTADHFQEAWATGLEWKTGLPWGEAVPVGEGVFSIGRAEGGALVPGLSDEAAKINVNTASADVLLALLERTIAGQADPGSVRDAILDWRDAPEGAPCQASAWPCRHAPLASVEELRLVPGMTAPAFEALAPYATVYTDGAVNINTASAVVLDALGYPGETIVSEREGAPFTFDTLPPAYAGLAVASGVFTVPVEAAHEQLSGRLRLAVVLDRAACQTPDRAGCFLTWHTSHAPTE